MKYIAPIAVLAILLLEFSGAIPRASVGGPMTIAFVFLVAALTVGIHDAWSQRRGVLGWIVSIVASVGGGFLAAMLGGMVMDAILSLVQPEGALADTRHPLLYVSLAGMMLLMLLGSWTALRIVSRWR